MFEKAGAVVMGREKVKRVLWFIKCVRKKKTERKVSVKGRVLCLWDV